jgi:hypothetical protein
MIDLSSGENLKAMKEEQLANQREKKRVEQENPERQTDWSDA